jgi:hypothetical protein
MSFNMKNRLLILLIIAVGTSGKAQLVKETFIVEPKIHTGMILPFYEALSYLIQDDIYAFDISISFPTTGEEYWDKLYRYPRPGIGYSYWNLGNNQVLGRAQTLYGFINIPLFKKDEKFSVNYQISAGGAYLTKIFDPFDNHLNRAIGSHYNIYMRLGIDGKIKLTPLSELVIEMGATHFSNGKTRSPNYGINAGTISLGFNYLINSSTVPIHDEPDIPDIEKKYIHSVIYSAGTKVYDNLFGNRYFVSSVSYNLEKIVSQKRKIGLGADFSYDGSINEALSLEQGVPDSDFSDLVRIGLHSSYAIRYKQFAAGIQVGYYLYSKHKVLTSVYNKLSLQYLFTDHIFGSASIKSHWGKADCLLWGIGYTW